MSRRIGRTSAWWVCAVLFAAACGGGDGGGGTGPQTGAASGSVVNESSANAGVSGVALTMTKGSTTRNATTNSSGAFSFTSLEAGAWTLAFALPTGFELGTGESASRSVTVTAGQTAQVGQIKIRPVVVNPALGTISGSVTASGSGVGNVSLALTGGGTTTTNSSGEYTFNNVQPGARTVTITVPAGFTLATGETAAKNTTVSAGQAATLNWALQATGGGNFIEINMQNTAFSPQNVTAAVGQQIRWTNRDAFAHNATAENGAFASANLNQNQTFVYTTTAAGTINYECTLHPGMTGRITVQ